MVASSLLAFFVLAADPPAVLAQKAHAVIRQHCRRCHPGDGGDVDFLSGAALKGSKDPQLVGKKAADSLIYERMAIRKNGNGDMPPPSIKDRPSQEDKDAIKAWLDAGAPDFAIAKTERPRVLLKDLLKTVRDYLRDARREDRDALRFFTLHHLHNNPAVSDADLRLYRAALSKALNSLSWSPTIVLPKAVDKTETLFVVDLRRIADYRGRDWLASGKWERVIATYPYGLSYGQHGDQELQRLDEDLTDLTHCDLPWLRADWFVATATRPPLYHDLLDIPDDARKLEATLGVDVAEHFVNPSLEVIARSGFSRSFISGQNRLIERHRSRFGSYWKSYDFKADNGLSNLMRFPLGPVNLGHVRHPFPKQAFDHDGGEIIFTLPNGLQGYMLVNGKDGRINAGPIEVVSDITKTSGTVEIINGVSCIACHSHGMKEEFKDALRDSSALLGDAEKHVQRLHPPNEDMKRLVSADRRKFMAALEESVGPFLRVGDEKDKPLERFPEPVGAVSSLHRLTYLDAQAVACELDLASPADLKQVGDKKLKLLGLDDLARPGGLVPRLAWEATNGVSLMQELARELRYTPRRSL